MDMTNCRVCKTDSSHSNFNLITILLLAEKTRIALVNGKTSTNYDSGQYDLSEKYINEGRIARVVIWYRNSDNLFLGLELFNENDNILY